MLPDPDFHYARKIIGDREISVVPLTFGRARIVIGPVNGLTYDDGW